MQGVLKCVLGAVVRRHDETGALKGGILLTRHLEEGYLTTEFTRGVGGFLEACFPHAM